MGSVVLGAVGAIAGGLIGGPAGIALGFSAGAAVGGIAFPPKEKIQERGKLSDLRVQGSGYGNAISQVFGLARVAGNVIWATDLVQSYRDESAGGKGALSPPDVRDYIYYGNFAVGVCAGPITAIHRIWAEDLLIYDDTFLPATQFNITIYLGTETQTSDPFMESYVGTGNNPAYRGMAYVVFDKLPLHKWGNRIPNLTFEVDAGGATTGSILSSVMLQSGLTASQYDVSLATTSVVGFVMDSRQKARDFIDPLLMCYALDLAEADGTIKVIPRGGATDITVNINDIGTDFYKGGDSGGDTPPKLKARRLHDLELPVSVEVGYFSSEKIYESGIQRAVRYSRAGWVKDALTVNTSLTMTDDKARQVAEYLLYDQWISRDQTELTLPPSYIQAIPGSVMLVPVAGSTIRYRVIRMDISIFGPIQFTLVKDDTNILIQTIAGGSLGTITDTLINPTTVLFRGICCNALRDEDADQPGYYMFAAGDADNWDGVQVYQARNIIAGTGYNPTVKIQNAATYGQTLGVLAAGKSTADMDNVTTMDINLQTGSIASVTMDDILNGNNAALVGTIGNGYELIQFMNVLSLGSGNYRLSGLIRGQRGTDYFWGTHASGDDFILVDEATIKRKNVDRTLLGKSILLKAITNTQQLSDATPVTVTVTGQELRPYMPCQIAGVRGGGGDLTITWVRRARENAEWSDLSDIGLDEPAEFYQVEVYSDGTYGHLIRTFSMLTSATVTYTSAQQVTDFGSNQNPVYLKIYQWGDFPQNNSTSPRQLGYPATVAL